MEYERGEVSKSGMINFTERLEWLMKDFQNAKAAGDNERINSLRQQIWVAKDLAAGRSPSMPAEDLQEIMMELQQNQKQCVTEEPSVFDKPPVNDEVTSNTEGPKTDAHIQITLLEKKLRKLTKKQSEIKKLKERLAAGESLEINQVQKINREKAINDQIDDVEEELFRLQRT